MRALVIVAVLTGLSIPAVTAAADRDLCAPGTRFRGATVDLDVTGADIRDVFRLLADVGKVNLVVDDQVAGKVTMKLRRVPWDQVACTVAAVHKLRITVQDTILIINIKR